MKTLNNQKNLLGQIRKRLVAEFGERLKGVVVYGSEARNEATRDSDVDVLVLLDSVENFGDELRRCIDTLFPLSLEIGRRISAKPVPFLEYENIDCPLYRHAHKEGIAA